VTLTLSGLAVFTGVYLTAVAAPGPGVAATVARALGGNSRGAVSWVTGFVIGDLIWFWAAVAGLSVIAKTHAAVLDVLRYCGAAYLLYVAWKLWSAPTGPLEGPATADDEAFWKPCVASLSLTIGNPKVIVFFMAVLPNVVDLARLTIADIAVLSAVIVVVLGGIMAAYSLAGLRARRLFARPSAIRILNRITGGVIAGAAVAIARN
jgi:threonine/homoserine/homoserine lactone efflux protein